MSDKPDFIEELKIPQATLDAINPMSLPVQFDPLDKFPNVPQARLVEACGILPHFVLTDDAPIRANLEHCYQFGIHESSGGSIDPDGMYHFPGDPDLAPMAVIRKGEERMFIYRSAIVAILGDDGSCFVTRCD